MKVNQNIKINPKYKLMALLSLLLAMGCARYEHKNVIQGISKKDKTRIFLLKDAETNEERILSIEPAWNSYVDIYADYDYLQPGDTVVVYVRGLLSDGYYSHSKVLSSEKTYGDVGMVYEYMSDTLAARKIRAGFNKECETFEALKQEMQSDLCK